jgi:hypothetical protein
LGSVISHKNLEQPLKVAGWAALSTDPLSPEAMQHCRAGEASAVFSSGQIISESTCAEMQSALLQRLIKLSKKF